MAFTVSLFSCIMNKTPNHDSKAMADQKQNPNGRPPMPAPAPGKTNWGLWILLAVITGILALAFMSDDGFGGSTKKLTLEEF